jgi:hypothetical protein
MVSQRRVKPAALPPDVRKVSDLPWANNNVLGLCPGLGRSPYE